MAIGLTVPHYGVEIARMRLCTPWFQHATVTGTLYEPLQAQRAGFLDEVCEPAQVLPLAEACARAARGS